LRLLAWNIRQGGGTRLAGIIAAIVGHDADVVVLSEYHAGPSGERLRAALADIGYRHASATTPPPAKKGVVVASRRRFREHGPLTPDLPEPWRLVDVEFAGLHVTGVYMPNLLAKVPYWEALLAALAARRSRRALVIGDFNTCRAFLDEPGKTDRCAHFLDRVDAVGFRDVWRRRNPTRVEPTWFSHRNNGFRIDHAFFSLPLARRAGAIHYSHKERMAGLSDHSVMIVDI
jgi:exodeoxyribonuclease-3